MGSIAIIPARSGSKGVPDKNIRPLKGKPLIAYTIQAALESGIFDSVFVSTDSEKYAKIAVTWGAEVPFLRSREMSTDTASSWDVVREVINCYEQIGKTYDTIALLQPTSPLRKASDIIDCYALMNDKRANSVISVCETDHSPLWCNTLPEDRSLNGFIRKECLNAPRQLLPIYYRINGAIYLVKSEYLISGGNLYGSGSYAFIMSKRNSVDIDTELDFCVAEAIIEYGNKVNKKF